MLLSIGPLFFAGVVSASVVEGLTRETFVPLNLAVNSHTSRTVPTFLSDSEFEQPASAAIRIRKAMMVVRNMKNQAVIVCGRPVPVVAA